MTQQTRPSEVARIFDAELRAADAPALAGLGPRYNVAPTQPLAVVVGREEGRFVELHRWGLVPPWAAGPGAVGARMINARAESVAQRPAFRTSLERWRCIVPADGFYEWRGKGRQRQPYLLAPRYGAPLAMAGLWAPWRDARSGEWLLSCAVITTRANATVGPLHDRMPVLLPATAWAVWLDPTLTDRDMLSGLLEPARDDLLTLTPVSSRVNSPHNEGPELIAPVDADGRAELTLFG